MTIELDDTRREAAEYDRLRRSAEILPALERRERQVQAQQRRAVERMRQEERLKAAVGRVREQQSAIPRLVERVVTELQSLVAAIKGLGGDAFEEAHDAAARLSRLDFEDAIEREEVEAKRTGWPVNSYAVGQGFGGAHTRQLMLNAGLPQRWDGVEETPETIVVSEAIDVLCGVTPPRRAGLR
jgi:hypothetical protein